MWVVYGIKNCDTVKKSLAWLENKQISYRFHDYRLDGIDLPLLERFTESLGLEAILNQRSTSWRQLDNQQKQNLTTEQALQLMLAIPTLIKRPILDKGQQLIVGFKPELWI